MTDNWTWIKAVLKLNWANATAHMKSFYIMMFFMCLQNLLYFSMWVVFFSQISSLRGWGLREVAFLYASGVISFGILFSVFGGLNQLGATIQNGEMDIHLARPRSPLLLALMQRMRTDSIGDIVTGVIMMVWFVKPPLETWPTLVVLSISAGLVYASFRLIGHSLSFWGFAGETGENAFTAFLITATNPQKGFGPVMKGILLTVFPAGYIAFLPVEIMREFRWDYMIAQLAGSGAVFAFALWFFHFGLRHYASGNKFLVLR